MVITQTQRLTLRLWTLDDDDAALRVWGDPAAMVFAGGAMAPERVGAVLQAATQAQSAHGCQLWAVELKERGEVVGACGFHPGEEPGELELAFHFDPGFWGRGYGTEAARGALTYAFDTLGASRIVSSAHVDHKASRRVLEKLGFTFEGTEFFDDLAQVEAVYGLEPKGHPSQKA